MKTAKEDRSFLRLIGIAEKYTFAADVNSAEAILGSSGTISPGLFGRDLFHAVEPRHLRICHSPAGWYLQALNGSTLHNGDAVRAGMMRKIADGDFIHMGDCVLRAEVLEDRTGTVRHPLSSMRLIGISENETFVLEARPEGSIMGRPQHLEFWYSRGEWYLRALSEMTLLNGEEINTGINKRILDGDYITIGACVMQAEIVRNGNG